MGVDSPVVNLQTPKDEKLMSRTNPKADGIKLTL